MSPSAALTCLVALPLTAIAAGQQLPEDLGVDPRDAATADFISANGQILAGVTLGFDLQIQFQPITSRPFRWTPENGVEWLGGPTEFFEVTGLSADGRIVAATETIGGNQNGVYWDESGQRFDIGSLGGGQTETCVISGDGSTIVGHSALPSGVRTGFRWTATGGMQDTGDIEPIAVSFDGAVILTEGGRWTASTGLVPFPLLGGATSMTDDGSAVVGRTDPGFDDSEIWLWSSANGQTVIALEPPDPMGGSQYVTGPCISGDGSTVAWGNWAAQLSPQTGRRWDTATGAIQVLNDILPASISANGSTITGNGFQGPDHFWTAATGVVELGGVPTSSTDQTPSPKAISRDGQWIAGGDPSLGSFSGPSAAVRWSVSGEIGARYCGAAVINSGGRPAVLRATGTNYISRDAIVLRAHSLPQNAAGFFLASRTAASVFPVVNSEGRLCLGGAIGRFVGPGQVQNSGPTGTFDFELPLDAIATPAGSVSALQGDTWNFQAWFRDANPTPTSNFSNGVRVMLR